MATIIRKTTAADRNLPRTVGGTRIHATIYTDGPLAGHTVITAPPRALRVFPAGGGWRALTDDEAAALADVDDAEDPADLAGWAVDLVSGTVGELEDALGDLDPAGHTRAHVEALISAESAGKDRTTAIEAINSWGDAVE